MRVLLRVSILLRVVGAAASVGRGVDGPLAGCVVWLDENLDCVQQPLEPASSTDADGFFDLTITASAKLALRPGLGCNDTHIGLPQPLRLSAPAGAYAGNATGQIMMSPLVTLSAALVDYTASQSAVAPLVVSPLNAAQAAGTIQSHLGLPGSIDIYRYDPFAEVGPTAASVLLATVQVGALANQLDALEQALLAATTPLAAPAAPPSPSPLAPATASASAACSAEGGASYRRVAEWVGSTGLAGLLSNTALLQDVGGVWRLGQQARDAVRLAMLNSYLLIAESGDGIDTVALSHADAASVLQRRVAAAGHAANGYVVGELQALAQGGSVASFVAATTLPTMRVQRGLAAIAIPLRLPVTPPAPPPHLPTVSSRDSITQPVDASNDGGDAIGAASGSAPRERGLPGLADPSAALTVRRLRVAPAPPAAANCGFVYRVAHYAVDRQQGTRGAAAAPVVADGRYSRYIRYVADGPA